MARLFVAAWPTPGVAELLAEFDRPNEPGVRWIPRENWHITLRFIGDAAIDEIASRLGEAALPRSVAQLGPAIGRLGRRQLVIPAAGVDALAAAVRTATAGIGHVDRHRFRGHLTVARLPPNTESAVAGQPIRGEFEIAEVALVTSELLATGAVYRTVASFPTT
jgi:2'-5' RNA ligase